MEYILVRIVNKEDNNKRRVVLGSHHYTEDQLEQLSTFISETNINGVELCIALEVI